MFLVVREDYVARIIVVGSGTGLSMNPFDA
jgi:hypothetical protein